MLNEKIRKGSGVVLGPEKAKAILCAGLGSRFARPGRWIGSRQEAIFVSLGLLFKDAPPGVTTGDAALRLGRLVGARLQRMPRGPRGIVLNRS